MGDKQCRGGVKEGDAGGLRKVEYVRIGYKRERGSVEGMKED